ncbi:hypothetical protein [Bacillus gaemokensis]|uniref:hypothetical protein n=1 Tax=Bacillus gaemokensis TaxID=574375 RepID=UPI000B13201D
MNQSFVLPLTINRKAFFAANAEAEIVGKTVTIKLNINAKNGSIGGFLLIDLS